MTKRDPDLMPDRDTLVRVTTRLFEVLDAEAIAPHNQLYLLAHALATATLASGNRLELAELMLKLRYRMQLEMLDASPDELLAQYGIRRERS